MNFEIDEDEVVLYEGSAGYKDETNKMINTLFTLTSKKMVFEHEKGVFKKQKELIDIINLNDIKTFNGEVQCKQKANELHIQTNNKNFTISLYGMIEAKKVHTKILNIITGTTVAERGSDKVKNALDLVDDTLGLNTREMTKGILENGIKGSIINGFKKNNK